jgi:subtilisin-like proprotein convertase family protein
MKTTIYEFSKKASVKNFILAITIVAIASCSKNEDKPAVVEPVLPVAIPVPSAEITLSNTTVFNIPDAVTITAPGCGNNATLGTIFSPITVDKEGVIKDASKITIEIDIVHKFTGDIIIELQAPSGESCGLLKRVYATSDSSCNPSVNASYVAGNKLSFNSLNTTALGSGAIATGSYKTTGPNAGAFPSSILMTPLSTFFTDKSIKGVWKLIAYDCSAADLGKINAWKIKFDTGALK